MEDDMMPFDTCHDNFDDPSDFLNDFDEREFDDYAESMDGDHTSALASAGWGTDEDYGHFDDGLWDN